MRRPKKTTIVIMAGLILAGIAGASYRQYHLARMREDLGYAARWTRDLRPFCRPGLSSSPAMLDGYDLSHVNLAELWMWSSSLRGTRLTGANLHQADLSHSDLAGADLRHCILSGATLRRVRLDGADIRDADLTDANLQATVAMGTDFRGADLSNAYFGGCVLMGADLRDTTVDGATFAWAIYNAETKWPAGFDVSAHEDLTFWDESLPPWAWSGSAGGRRDH